MNEPARRTDHRLTRPDRKRARNPANICMSFLIRFPTGQAKLWTGLVGPSWVRAGSVSRVSAKPLYNRCDGQDESGLAKMRWFGFFVAAKKNEDETTSGNDQNTADPNQFRRHVQFPFSEFLSYHRLCCPLLWTIYDEVADGRGSPSRLCR